MITVPVPAVGTASCRLIAGAALAALVSGCYSISALDSRMEKQVVKTAATEPGMSEEASADAAQNMTPPAFPAGVVMTLNSRSVLEVATDYSRTLQTRRDDLYRAGLSLFSTRRDFGFGVSATLEYIFSGSDTSDDSDRGSATLSVDRTLVTGGKIALTGQQDIRDELLGNMQSPTYSSRGQVRLDQPLLSGAGYQASHEDLTQAEREYLYALRDFTLQRQVFAIETLREYYNLLSQRKVVENTETNYQQFVYLRQRSEALFKVNRAPAIDVLRSQQEELTALNRLTSTRESYQIAIGRFLVLLGLPSDLEATLADDVPDIRKVDLDEEKAVTLALSKRLDLETIRDRQDDAERQLKVARNIALPKINLFGASGWTASDADSIGAQEYANDWQAGVEADIPIDRRDERDAVKRAQLDLDAAKRRLAAEVDNVALEVRESYSKLRSLTVSVEIQLKNIEIAERRAENALLQFRNGTLSNRDVVEASNALLDARNAYIAALTDYEIQRLTLLRQIGLLDISRDGSIIELNPEA